MPNLEWSNTFTGYGTVHFVQLTTSDTEASASFDFKSEEREEIADVPAPAPTLAPALERIKEQSTHTPGSRKSTRKNFGKPASSFSDFYM